MTPLTVDSELARLLAMPRVHHEQGLPWGGPVTPTGGACLHAGVSYVGSLASSHCAGTFGTDVYASPDGTYTSYSSTFDANGTNPKNHSSVVKVTLAEIFDHVVRVDIEGGYEWSGALGLASEIERVCGGPEEDTDDRAEAIPKFVSMGSSMIPFLASVAYLPQ
jgi:hypothetical protein